MAERVDRRGFLRLGALGAASAGLPSLLTSCTSPPPYRPTGAYAQGVTSGFHSSTEVVIWTRIEPAVAGALDSCTWEVSPSPSMSPVVASGTAEVDAARDHTVKVLVGDLEPDRSYWYRFRSAAGESPTGRARTLPAAEAEPARLRLAFGSCQAFGTGWYAAWRDIARRDLDGVVFLGDFIYEAGPIQLLRPIRPEPVAECITLEQYREKYRLYRSDPDLQAAGAAHPWAVVWDDHELRNDWDRTVIDLDPRRWVAASQAWFEHQPVWPTEGTRIHRTLHFGRLASLHLLDSRQHRDPPVPTLFGASFMTPQLADPGRTMLGAAQRAWLLDAIEADEAAGVRHRLLGNQVLLGPVRLLDLDTPATRALDPSLPRHAGLYGTTDTWDGFPAERDALLAALGAAPRAATTVLTGDIHSFWAGSIRADFDDETSPVVAREFAGGAISSPTGGPQSALGAGGTHPAWDLVDDRRNGFGIVECTPDAVRVDFVGVDARWRAATPATFATFDRQLTPSRP